MRCKVILEFSGDGCPNRGGRPPTQFNAFAAHWLDVVERIFGLRIGQVEQLTAKQYRSRRLKCNPSEASSEVPTTKNRFDSQSWTICLTLIAACYVGTCLTAVAGAPSPPPLQVISVKNSLAVGTSGLIQSSFTPRGSLGNLEAVVQYGNRLIHFWRDNTLTEWRGGQTISTTATGPASIIQSSFKSRDHGNFEVVVQEGNQIVHYFHDNADLNLLWRRGQTISTRATGPASIIRSSFKSGKHGNFEVVVQEGTQIVHYFNDNADVNLPWRRGQTISARATGPATIIQSSFKSGEHGNFEVVVQEGNEIVHYFNDNSEVNVPWRRGQTISTRATGPASIIQSSLKSGDHGNFEVVVQEGRELAHYFHDNSDGNHPWKRGQTISTRATGSASIVQSTFKSGTHGNFEVVVPEGNQLVHYFHDNSDVNLPWRRAPQVFGGATAARSEKICQVSGNWEFQMRSPTRTLTDSRFELTGTDLGFPFEHNGRWFILFGDTRPRDRGQDDGRDSLAIVNGRDRDGCPQVSFVSDRFGGGVRFRPLKVPGVSLGFFEVPTGGFSAFGHMYAFQWTDHLQDLATGTFSDPIGHTALTRSDDDGRTFRRIYEDLGDRFVYVTPALVRRGTVAGLPPSSSGDGLLIWAAGAYRDSDPYLAYVPLVSEQALESKSSLHYFSGIDAVTGDPTWSQQELHAQPVFHSADPCIGEFSVTWEPNLRQWLMLYNCDPHGIIARRANDPWGPWSDPTVVFRHDVDGGFCTFMHAGLAAGCGAHLNDPASPVSGQSAPGESTRPMCCRS